MMTQDALDALPELSMDIGYRETLRDGKRVRIPVVQAACLFQGAEDPLLIVDRQGRAWSVGWVQGTRYKVRRRQWERERS